METERRTGKGLGGSSTVREQENNTFPAFPRQSLSVPRLWLWRLWRASGGADGDCAIRMRRPRVRRNVTIRLHFIRFSLLVGGNPNSQPLAPSASWTHWQADRKGTHSVIDRLREQNEGRMWKGEGAGRMIIYQRSISEHSARKKIPLQGLSASCFPTGYPRERRKRAVLIRLGRIGAQ